MLSFTDYVVIRDSPLHTLNEVSRKAYNKIIDQITVASKDPSKLSFNNIFQNKTRVAIPFFSDDYKQLAMDLRQTGYEPDFSKGLAYKTINTQRGAKQTSVKIGKAIEGLNSPFWKDFWNKQGGTYSIIISRNPVDILRMSDFKGIESCHSEGGDYFYCALDEAKEGGLIAYLVKTPDLKNIDLKAPEVFTDPDRSIQGITPIARLRLRRLVSKDEETELAIPELRVYGNNQDGFQKAVSSWAKEAQGLTNTKPKMKDFIRYGGKYQDNISSRLWNNFFGTSETGDVKFSGGGGSMLETWRKEMEQIQDEYQRNFKHFWFHYTDPGEVGEIDDENPIFYWDIDLGFEFNAKEFKEVPEYKDHNKIRELLNDIAYFYIDDIDIDEQNNKVYIRCKIGEGNYGNPDKFREDLQYLLDEEKKYDEINRKLRFFLIENGYLYPSKIDSAYKIITANKFKHFQTSNDPEDNGYVISSEPIVIGQLNQFVPEIKWDNPGETPITDPLGNLAKRYGDLGRKQQRSRYDPKTQTFWKRTMPENDDDPALKIKQGLGRALSSKLIQQLQQYGKTQEINWNQQQWLPGFSKPSFTNRAEKIINPVVQFKMERSKINPWSNIPSVPSVVAVLNFNIEQHTEIKNIMTTIAYFDKNWNIVEQKIRQLFFSIIKYR